MQLCTNCGNILGKGISEVEDEDGSDDCLVCVAHNLREALKPLAAIPYQDFDYRKRDEDHRLMCWNGICITIGDVKRARRLLGMKP